MRQNSAKKHKIAAVLLAAGRGERAGGLSEGPKQYRTIGGKSVIARTLQAFIDCHLIDNIVLVTHMDDDELLQAAISELGHSKLIFCHGGATRQESGLKGLKELKDMDIDHVMIHDAVRPFVSTELLEQIVSEHENGHDAVLPAVAVTDTLKRTDDRQIVQNTVSRDLLFAAQTPQSFNFEKILNAHQDAAKAGKNLFTDDCAVAEWADLPIRIIDGEISNVKLTTKEDIIMADEKLSPSLPDVRTGNGYDVHQLVDGDFVTLCGIDIPHNKRLSGHSDADVALHALTDALLATCGAGDIGDHFPPSDPKWKGAASHIFLEEAVAIVREHGGEIMNADISLIAEQPKIGPHKLKMRENLAKILNIDVERCSVKATTNEKIGFIGREEGIAAISTATVVYGR